MRRIHVIGAGVAGLACAVELVRRGVVPVVHEATLHGGGRCRSFHDATLDRRIDNGNHLLLSGNWAVRGYLDTVGAADGFHASPSAAFPFVDLVTDERWTLRPNAGRLPWWLLVPSRRVPGSRITDYLAAYRLKKAGGVAVARVFRPGTVAWRRFWEPLALGVLNTAADEADAGLLWPVMAETFLAGEAACRPLIARHGLSEALIDPGIAWLRDKGADLRLGRRLKAIECRDGRAAALEFDDARVALAGDDAVVLAVPPGVASQLLPGLRVPTECRTIVNGHFRLARPLTPPAQPQLVGVVGGVAQWLFLRGDVVSVTVSAADALARHTGEAIAAMLWDDVRRCLRLGDLPLPPWRIIKEKRATIAQTPQQVALRPLPRIGLANLFLAGDWIDTGLPATIEGAMRSGRHAADLAWGTRS